MNREELRSLALAATQEGTHLDRVRAMREFELAVKPSDILKLLSDLEKAKECLESLANDDGDICAGKGCRELATKTLKELTEQSDVESLEAKNEI